MQGLPLTLGTIFIACVRDGNAKRRQHASESAIKDKTASIRLLPPFTPEPAVSAHTASALNGSRVAENILCDLEVLGQFNKLQLSRQAAGKEATIPSRTHITGLSRLLPTCQMSHPERHVLTLTRESMRAPAMDFT